MQAKEKLEKLFEGLYAEASKDDEAQRVTEEQYDSEEETMDEEDKTEMEKVVTVVYDLKEKYNSDIKKIVSINTKLLERIITLEEAAEPKPGDAPDTNADKQTPDPKVGSAPETNQDKQSPDPKAVSTPDTNSEEQESVDSEETEEESTDSDDTQPKSEELVEESEDAEEPKGDAEEEEPQPPISEALSNNPLIGLNKEAHKESLELVEVFRKLK